MKQSRSSRNRSSRRFFSKKKEKEKKQYQSKSRDERRNGGSSYGRKQRDDALQLVGTVTESLPSGKFNVELDNEHRIVAYLGGKLARNRIWILPGDKVNIEVSPYDLTRGHIVWRDSGRRG